MKRSRINAIMATADAMIRRHGFALPPFAYWSPPEFKSRQDAGHIVASSMGWDITDFGQGRFDQIGLFLFTLRNGSLADLRRGGGMCYAEKLLIAQADQVTPMHTHVIRGEDIINRGGATLVVELFGSDDQGRFAADRGSVVRCDGISTPFKAGTKLRLPPGFSVTLMPGDCHAFWGEGGDVRIGEVSTVNDDVSDNLFRDPVGRFAQIDEDEPPTHLLVADYANWL